jgi:hypothetical protein
MNLWKTCKFSTSEQSNTDKSSDSNIHNHNDVLISDTGNDSDNGDEITYVPDSNSLWKKQTIKMDTFTEVRDLPST